MSRSCLLVAVAALGMRTSIRQFAIMGPGVASAIVLQSLFLMTAALTLS